MRLNYQFKGKQASPVAVLCLQGSPDPLPVCGMPRTLQRAQVPQRPRESNRFLWMKLVDVGCVERGEEPWWAVHSFGVLAQGGSLCLCLSDADMGWGEFWGTRQGEIMQSSLECQLLEALPGDTQHCRASDAN